MRRLLCALAALVVVGAPAGFTQPASYDACRTEQDTQILLEACAAFLATEPPDEDHIVIAHLRRGAAYLRLDDTSSAIAEYDLLLRRHPENEMGFANRGLAKFHSGDFDGAILDLSRGVELGARDSDIFATRAAAHFHKGELDATLRDADRALAMDEHNTLALAMRGYVRRERGALREALSDITRASQISPREAALHHNRGEILLLMGEAREAVNAFTAAIALDPRNVDFFVRRAQAHVNIGDLDVAFVDFDTAVRLAPHDANAILLRAIIYEQRGQFDRADADILRAAELAPNLPETLVGLARMGLRNGEIAVGLSQLNQAISIDPEISDAYFQRAQLNSRIGRFGAAITDLDRAIALAPSPDFYNARGYFRMVLGDEVAARADFERALEATPRFNPALHNLAWLLLRLDQDADAVRRYSEVFASGHREPGAYVERGLAHWSMGDLERARADIARALELDGQHYYANRAHTLLSSVDPEAKADALAAAGALLIYMNDLDEAIAIADRANALHPERLSFINQRCWARAVAGRELDVALDACNSALAPGVNASVLDSRGLVYLKLGRFQDAWNDFNTAVGLNSNMAPYLYGRGVAALRLGRSSEGDADILRAAAMRDGIAIEYANYGIVP